MNSVISTTPTVKAQELAYVLWAKQYIHFHGMRHPS